MIGKLYRATVNKHVFFRNWIPLQIYCNWHFTCWRRTVVMGDQRHCLLLRSWINCHRAHPRLLRAQWWLRRSFGLALCSRLVFLREQNLLCQQLIGRMLLLYYANEKSFHFLKRATSSVGKEWKRHQCGPLFSHLPTEALWLSISNNKYQSGWSQCTGRFRQTWCLSTEVLKRWQDSLFAAITFEGLEWRILGKRNMFMTIWELEACSLTDCFSPSFKWHVAFITLSAWKRKFVVEGYWVMTDVYNTVLYNI